MVAPPGYGKSTSLALWRARERRPVAWVTCDAADADPIRFLGYVGLAIERALDLATPIFDGVTLNAESALSFAVPRLTSALHAARLADGASCSTTCTTSRAPDRPTRCR